MYNRIDLASLLRLGPGALPKFLNSLGLNKPDETNGDGVPDVSIDAELPRPEVPSVPKAVVLAGGIDSIAEALARIGGGCGLRAAVLSELVEEVEPHATRGDIQAGVNIDALLTELELARKAVAAETAKTDEGSKPLFEELTAQIDHAIKHWTAIQDWNPGFEINSSEFRIRLVGTAEDLQEFGPTFEAKLEAAILDLTIEVAQKHGYQIRIGDCGRLHLSRNDQDAHVECPGDVEAALARAGIDLPDNPVRRADGDIDFAQESFNSSDSSAQS